jgi:hypothetical protein
MSTTLSYFIYLFVNFVIAVADIVEHGRSPQASLADTGQRHLGTPELSK